MTIVIGDKTDLVIFTNKESENIICSKNTFTKIKKNFQLKDLKNFDPKQLHKQKFIFDFERAEIINHINDFSIEKNKLDLNKIHIIDSKKVENFIPNIKNYHFRIAQNMHLPIICLIENNFIKKSIININDEKSMIEKLKPIFLFKEKKIFDFEKNTNNKLYIDIKKEIYIKLNKELLIDKIKYVPKINIEKEKLIEKINLKSNIEISNSNGKIPIPIFK